MLTVLTQKARKYRHWHRLKRRRDVAPPTEYYFGFGANVLPGRFQANHMNFAWVGKARAPGRRLVFGLGTYLHGMGYASLAEEAGAEAWGVLYKLDAPSLELLDVLEWVRYGYYRRILVDVVFEGESGPETVRAWTYEALAHRTGLMPSTEYLHGILKTGRELGYPEDYLQSLALQEHRPFRSFPVNHAFRIANLEKERPLPGLLTPLYKVHDALRRQIMTRLP